MRRNGNEVGIDHGFTIDPDNNGADALIEDANGNRAYGLAGFEGTTVEIRHAFGFNPYGKPGDDDEDAYALVKPGVYALIWEGHDHGPDEELDHPEEWCYYQTLAELLDWMYDDEAGFLAMAKKTHDIIPPQPSVTVLGDGHIIG